MPFDLGELRRHPDVEGHGLEASDAADRLILDEARILADGLGPTRPPRSPRSVDRANWS